MPKTLVIVESPTKAGKIQEYLGSDFIVKSSKGHIVELSKSGEYNCGIDIKNGFKARYTLMNDKVNVLDDLIKTANICDNILLFSDYDREGEAISWHLYERLKDCGKPMKRGTFNEIKKDKILKAVQNPRDIDLNMVHSQQTRQMLDRIVGFTASPLVMNLFGPKLSAGRVQSVLTRMVIDKEHEIKAFKPETFFTINVNLSQDNKFGFQAKYSQKLTDKNFATNMKAKLEDTTKKYIVSEVLAEEEKKYPSAPFTTSTLQQVMSRVHSFSADRTMKAAQSLYESGYCTYIRTDSTQIGEEALTDVRTWISDKKYELPSKPYTYKDKDSAQSAHECIRPVDLSIDPANNYSMSDPDEKIVYEMIWKYFIASQMMPAIYNTLKVTASIENDVSAEVKASGKSLKSKGFLEILNINDNSKIDIPNLTKGDELYLFGKSPVKLEKKQTQPPPRYTEEKLLKELESRGIGRPATYADLLTKICSRNYVEKHGNVYHPTELGTKVIDKLKEYFSFLNYDYTKKMEEQLDLIEAGKLNYIDMLKTFYPVYKKELDNAYIGSGKTLCQKCQSPMIERTSKSDGHKFLGCSDWNRCKYLKDSVTENLVA